MIMLTASPRLAVPPPVAPISDYLQMRAQAPFHQSIPELTPAEERVLPYLLAGWSNKEIAWEMNRAEATIKNQVASLLRKFGQPSRARLIAALR